MAMNKYKLFKAGIDANEGIKRFCDDPVFYEEYLRKFSEDEHYSLLCKAIKENAVKDAFSAAHALKGIAGNLGLTDLYDDICPLVEELRADKLDNTAEMLELVIEDYNRVISAIEDMA